VVTADMILWTIQPEGVYQELQNTGIYHCDIGQGSMPEYRLEYDWFVAQMKKRIGLPPDGVKYPVWAWYKWEGKRKKPDLRRERWQCGLRGDIFYCLTIEIPDEHVLLSDFDMWSIILLHGLLSTTEEEDTQLEKIYDSLNPEEQKKMRNKNWEGAFDLTPLRNEWMTRGESIQATFWELRYEQVVKAQPFKAMSVYPSRPNDPRIPPGQTHI
jgi:hypothetical protein